MVIRVCEAQVGRKVNSNPHAFFPPPLHYTKADFEVDLRRQVNARVHVRWARLTAAGPGSWPLSHGRIWL